jgi:hypothetical protein
LLGTIVLTQGSAMKILPLLVVLFTATPAWSQSRLYTPLHNPGVYEIGAGSNTTITD